MGLAELLHLSAADLKVQSQLPVIFLQCQLDLLWALKMLVVHRLLVQLELVLQLVPQVQVTFLLSVVHRRNRRGLK